eukprot:g320.t1
MSAEEQLRNIETLCEKLYTSANKAERDEADASLAGLFAVSGESTASTSSAASAQGIASSAAAADVRAIPKHEFVLANSQSSFAIHFCTNALLRVVNDRWSSLNQEQRLQLRNFAFNCFALKGPQLQRYAVNTLIKLVCLITKLAWTDDNKFHDVVSGTTKFLSHQEFSYRDLGFRLLHALVIEMQGIKIVGLQRKGRASSMAFRDEALHTIFQASQRSLQELAPNADEFEEGSKEEGLLELALETALACLSYDFDSVGRDESSGEDHVVRLPRGWSESRDENTVGLFFELFQARPGTRSASFALECAGRIASVRRQVFTRKERSDLIVRLQRETLNIMTTSQGLDDEHNFLSFCRLLGTMKGQNFRLDEIVTRDTYEAWIRGLAGFTKKALEQFDEVGDVPLSYILGLWGALVRPLNSSSSYAVRAAGIPSHISRPTHSMRSTRMMSLCELFVPDILLVFIQSRMRLAEAVATSMVSGSGDVEDPLANMEPPAQLASIPMLASLKYPEAAAAITQCLDEETKRLIMAQSQGPGAAMPQQQVLALAVQEAKLSWLVQIAAGVIGAYTANKSKRSAMEERMNANLAGQVFRLMILICANLVPRESAAAVASDSQCGGSLWNFYVTPFRESLEMAFLQFVDQFRQSHVSPSGSKLRGASSSGRDGDPTRSLSKKNNSILTYFNPLLGNFDSVQDSSDDDDEDGGGGNDGSGKGDNAMNGADGDAQSEVTTHSVLCSMLHLHGQTAILDLIMGKIVYNLGAWANTSGGGTATAISTRVVRATLAILNEMACSVRIMQRSRTQLMYSSGKVLLQSAYLNRLFSNADISSIPFFVHHENGSQRTLFFSSLTRLLFIKLRESAADRHFELFFQFLAPLQSTAEKLGERIVAAAGQGQTGQVLSDDMKLAIAGWCRDMTGISSSILSRDHFSLLFEWMVPSKMPMLCAALKCWWNVPFVTTPVLKLIADLVHNRSHRIVFSPSSAGAYLLCRSACECVTTYMAALSQTVANADSSTIYQSHFKGMGLCMRILSRLLQGSYVNFGIMELYGDNSLIVARNAVLQLALSRPAEELLSYTKTTSAFFDFAEALAENDVHAIVSMPTPALQRFMQLVELTVRRSIHEAASAASIIESIASSCFECEKFARENGSEASAAETVAGNISAGAFAAQAARRKKMGGALESFAKLLGRQQFSGGASQGTDPTLFQRLLSGIFRLVVFENCQRQASMSRPLLPLILLEPQFYSNFIEQLLQSAAGTQQGMLREALQGLMAGVASDLNSQSKERFMQNLYKMSKAMK